MVGGLEACLIYRRPADVSIPNLYPHWEVLARAYLDLIQAWEWTSFTILYETTEGLYRMRELVKLYNSTGPTVVIRQLDNTNSGNYRYLSQPNAYLVPEVSTRYFQNDSKTSFTIRRNPFRTGRIHRESRRSSEASSTSRTHHQQIQLHHHQFGHANHRLDLLPIW